jgi:DNA-binding beta-propeller fold protein YncE
MLCDEKVTKFGEYPPRFSVSFPLLPVFRLASGCGEETAIRSVVTPAHAENDMIVQRKDPLFRSIFFGAAIFASLASFTVAQAQDDDDNNSSILSTGQKITPTAAPSASFELLNPGLTDFPNFVPSGALSTAISPDQHTLLILISGHDVLYNPASQVVPADSQEYVFVYDVSAGRPVKKQVLQVPNTFAGIAFSPSGNSFYVGGGFNDNIHTYAIQTDGSWAEMGTPIPLGHTTGNGIPTPSTFVTGGLAVTADGTKIVVANVYNDSISLVDIAGRSVIKEIDLRPGVIDPAQNGVPGGEYPFWVAIKGNDIAYVSSLRDREIVVVGLGNSPSVNSRIKAKGNPNKMILNRAQNLLFAAEDNSDSVEVVNTQTNQVVQSIATTGPRWLLWNVGRYRGSIPNSLTLSPDERVLYVTNGGTNSVAVVKLSPFRSEVVGLLPTGFYPTAVNVSADGRTLFVLNAKSPTGANPGWYAENHASNQYIEELEQSGLLSFPVPDFFTLFRLTLTVANNDSFFAIPQVRDEIVMRQLRRRIKHLIYIVKENRTYDQILGDLEVGNGDPSLALFGEATTPNFHKISQEFVDLDNFYCSGDVSANGWPWSVAARETDFGIKAVPLNYSSRGTSYEYEGTNRNVNVGLATVPERQAADGLTPSDPNLLPGTADVGAFDGPEGTPPERGYIWDAVARAGLSLREYGFFCDLTRYSAPPPNNIPLERHPFAAKIQVSYPTKPVLIANNDIYFRGYDNAFPDFWRQDEWAREFDGYVANGNLPRVELVRFMHDHTGSFSTSIDGVNTAELDHADNDYAVGLLVDKVAHSPYKDDTLIFVLEDDAQAGADHVDAHRSTAYVVGPYVKQGAVVSERYTTVNMLRTIEDILGLDHLNINTATQRPMTEIFDLSQRDWTYSATASDLLKNTQLPIPTNAFADADKVLKPLHDVVYWAEKTKEFDFSVEDNLKDPDKFNRITWEGVMGDRPYPSERTGADLRKNRAELLKKHRLTRPLILAQEK